jgi:hypothetical protein
MAWKCAAHSLGQEEPHDGFRLPQQRNATRRPLSLAALLPFNPHWRPPLPFGSRLTMTMCGFAVSFRVPGSAFNPFPIKHLRIMPKKSLSTI